MPWCKETFSFLPVHSCPRSELIKKYTQEFCTKRVPWGCNLYHTCISHPRILAERPDESLHLRGDPAQHLLVVTHALTPLKGRIVKRAPVSRMDLGRQLALELG